MCFSATASFSAGALLVGAGIVAIRQIESPKMLPFAAVPLLFGLQQLTEGITWLTFPDPELASLNQVLKILYVIFAFVVWPVWIPLSMWLMEPDAARKKILYWFLWIGGIIAAYIIYCLYAYEVTATIEGKHIRYQLLFPNLAFRRTLYFSATLLPTFISSLRFMKLLGGAILGSLIFSAIFFFYWVLSVWCFFAAILSLLVLLVIAYNKQAIATAP